MKSKKDLWILVWRITRIYFNQINVLGGGNMESKTLQSIIHMRRCYSFLLNNETESMLEIARKIFFKR